MSEMQSAEIIERYVEGLKRASSRARELGIAQKATEWDKVARNLDMLLKTGVKLFNSRQLSRHDTLKMLDDRQKNLKIPE